MTVASRVCTKAVSVFFRVLPRVPRSLYCEYRLVSPRPSPFNESALLNEE